MVTDAKHELGHRRTIVLRFFRNNFDPFKGKFFRLMMVPLLLGAIPLLPVPWLFSLKTTPTFSLAQGVMVGMAFALAMLLFALARAAFEQKLALVVEPFVRQTVLQKVHEVPIEVLEKAPGGEWLNNLREDVLGVERFLSERLPAQITGVFLFLSTGYLLVYLARAASFLPLALGVLAALGWGTYRERLAPFFSRYRGQQAGLFQFWVESVKAVRTIRSFEAHPFIERKFEMKLRESMMPVERFQFRTTAKSSGAPSASFWLLTLGLTFTAVDFGNQENVEHALCYPILIALFLKSSLSISDIFRQWREFFLRAGRLIEVLEERELRDSLSPPKFPPKPRIALQKFSVAQTSDKVVGPFDFTFSWGKIWGIVGPSHAGKSLVLEILAGIRPLRSGKVEILSESQEVLCSAEGKGSRLPLSICSLVEQKPYFFEGTLRENLLFGNPKRLSEAVLWDVLQKVGLAHLLKGPKGIDESFNENRKHLTESVKVRLALCRALLQQRPFLLLDEPFAFLDEASASQFISLLETLREEKGIIVVTQHIPEALSADGILDLEDLGPNKDKQKSRFSAVMSDRGQFA